MYRKLHAYYDDLGKIIHKLLDYPQASAVSDSIDILYNYRKCLARRIFLDLPEKPLIARDSPRNIPAPASAQPAGEQAGTAEAPHSQHHQTLFHLPLAAISFDLDPP
jgi:hypothetical protein